jgi:hypothetical protein
MLRPALIGLLALTTPASADLWTAGPAGSPSPPPRPAQPNPRERIRLAPPTTPEESPAALVLTVVLDPACSSSVPLAHDAVAFVRRHPDVALRMWLATWPRGSAEAAQRLGALADLGVPITWAPAGVRALAPAALPAVYLHDAQGRGVRATGRPPLEALWRAFHRRPA